jgi:hypothetical protein
MANLRRADCTSNNVGLNLLCISIVDLRCTSLVTLSNGSHSSMNSLKFAKSMILGTVDAHKIYDVRNLLLWAFPLSDFVLSIYALISLQDALK